MTGDLVVAQRGRRTKGRTMDWEHNWGPASYGDRGLNSAQESKQVHSGVSTITAISPPSSSTMTHLLPHRTDLNLQHSSLQSALQMDPSQAPQQPQQSPQQQQPIPPQAAPRKRKKVDANGDETPHQAEPRRLRRSHEACARCRSKKIKASPVGRHRRQIPALASPSAFPD